LFTSESIELPKSRTVGISARSSRLKKTIALRVVRLTTKERAHEIGDARRIHLPVAIDLDQDVHVVVQRRAVTAEHRATDAEVRVVDEDAHSSVQAVGANVHAGFFGTRIIHDVDRGDLSTDRLEHAEDLRLRAEAGHDDRDARCGILRHRFIATRRPRRLR
jgi:hypothetical protein